MRGRVRTRISEVISRRGSYAPYRRRPPELLPKLFDPFEQGGAEVARRHGGLGLGLAISQAIIQAHGGRLQAASPGPGQGATFTVDLPAWLQGSATTEPLATGQRRRTNKEASLA